jgi:hypothetical protein
VCICAFAYRYVVLYACSLVYAMFNFLDLWMCVCASFRCVRISLCLISWLLGDQEEEELEEELREEEDLMRSSGQCFELHSGALGRHILTSFHLVRFELRN